MTAATAETRQQRRFKARQERKPVHQQHGAFKRAMVYFREVMATREANLLLGPVTLELAMMSLLGRLGPYRSRGKGRATMPEPRYNEAAARSRYMPHQSVRECERRRIGGFAAQRALVARMAKMMYA